MTDAVELKTVLTDAQVLVSASGSYPASEKYIQKAIEALDTEARWRKQFTKTAIKTLLAKAAKDLKPGEAITFPSEVAINAEVERLLKNLRDKKA